MQDSDIDKIAALARLRISDEEREKLSLDIEQIIEYIRKISSVDTSGTAPLRHPPWQYSTMREDAVNARGEPELYQRDAPEKEDDYYLVPRVVE